MIHMWMFQAHAAPGNTVKEIENSGRLITGKLSALNKLLDAEKTPLQRSKISKAMLLQAYQAHIGYFLSGIVGEKSLGEYGNSRAFTHALYAISQKDFEAATALIRKADGGAEKKIEFFTYIVEFCRPRKIRLFGGSAQDDVAAVFGDALENGGDRREIMTNASLFYEQIVTEGGKPNRFFAQVSDYIDAGYQDTLRQKAKKRH